MRIFLLTLALLPVFASAMLPGNPDEYFDILGTGHKDWRFVFRGTAHIRKSMYSAYIDGTGIPSWIEDGCTKTNWSAPCANHWRNKDALENWANVREVLYGIVDDGKLIKTLRFKGSGSNYDNWMSKDRLVDSCWEDLETASTNYFSIQGHAAVDRRFFISHMYSSCPGDTSWTVVVDRESIRGACAWDRAETFPSIRYVPGQKWQNINSDRIKSAEAVVVFVNYYPGEPSEYHDLFGTGQDWRLAFRGTPGVGYPVYNAYLNGSGINANMDPSCKTVDWRAPCNSHYRNNDALDIWKNVDEVLFGIIYKGEMVKTIIFHGEQTTYLDWFSLENLKKSCWADLPTQPHRFFSIKGDETLLRRFFIQRQYGGCPNDVGWFVSSDNPPRPCPWETVNSYPMFKFAAGPKAENWIEGEVLEADAFAIFLKYKDL